VDTRTETNAAEELVNPASPTEGTDVQSTKRAGVVDDSLYLRHV
jgi:hypothetical protein